MIPLQSRTDDSGLSPFTSPALMADRPCPVCQSTEPPRPVQSFTDVQFYADGGPRVNLADVQCQVCYACYKNPTYTDDGMRVLFAQASASYGSEQPAERAIDQVAWVRAHAEDHQSILDFGCGNGEFLCTSGARDRYGVDIDPGLVMEAGACARVATTLNGLYDVPINGFDVITLWHVLEHLADPYALLTRLRESFSAAQTRLIVEVPTMDFRATDDISGFLSWMHVTHFSQASLRSLLRRAGWEIVDWAQQAYNGYRVCCRPTEPTQDIGGASIDLERAKIHVQQQQMDAKRVDGRLRSVGTRDLILWGAGLHTEMLYQSTSLREHMPVFLFDRDVAKQGTTWRGVPIVKPSGAVEWESSDLVISSYSSQDAIYAAALALGIYPERIVRLYDHPVSY